MRQEIDGAKYDEKVEAAVTEKQNVDKQMVEMADVMKMLTLHSSTRVRLGLKKTEAQAKEAAYNARCEKKKKKKNPSKINTYRSCVGSNRRRRI